MEHHLIAIHLHSIQTLRARSETRLYDLVSSRLHLERSKKDYLNSRIREKVRRLTSEVEDWPNFGISNTLAIASP